MLSKHGILLLIYDSTLKKNLYWSENESSACPKTKQIQLFYKNGSDMKLSESNPDGREW